MNIGRRTEFILYTLGKFYSECNKKLKENFLELYVSKKIFIGTIKEASITKLSERMIYRHLEMMEKKKLIKYDQKKLSFTKKGRKQFLKTRNHFEGYFNLGRIMTKKDITKLCAKSQTVFTKKKNNNK